MEISIEELRKKWKDSKEALSTWKKQAREDFAFVAGDQWTQEDISRLLEQERPAVTFNRIGAMIDSVCGIEINNRQEVRFYPREPGDVRVNEILSEAAKWARDQCYAEDEESDAFRDAAICGIGVTETLMDYEEEMDGQIVVKRRDPLNCGYDPAAKQKCLDDAQYVWHAEWEDKEEVEKKWGVEITSSDEIDEGSQPHDADKIVVYDEESDEYDRTKGKVLVVNIQCCKKKTFYRALDPFTQRMVELDEEGFKDLEKKVGILGFEFVGKNATSPNQIPYVKQQKKVYYRSFFVGEKLLEQDTIEYFTLRFITGKRDRNKNCFYGIVRGLKDPQRWGNKWLSQILDILSRNTKGGAFVEKGAFSDPKKAEEQWGSSNPLIEVNEGYIDRIRERGQGQYPTGIDRLMMFAFDSMPFISGLNLEMLGMADKAQAGVLEEQRKRSAIAILAPLFDSLRRYRKSQGKLLLYYIREFLADGRLIRITGQRGDMQYVPLIKDHATGIYDVVVDQSPSSPDFKEKIWNSMKEILPVMLKNGYQIPDVVIDMMPLPSWVSAEVKNALAGQLPPVAKQQIQQLQEMVQKLSAENQQLKQENFIKDADRTVDIAKVQANAQGKFDSNRVKEYTAELDSQTQRIVANSERASEELDRVVDLVTHDRGANVRPGIGS